jgi:hypothetical protein
MSEPAECQVPGCHERGALHPVAYVTDPVGVTDHVWLCAKHDEESRSDDEFLKRHFPH